MPFPPGGGWRGGSCLFSPLALSPPPCDYRTPKTKIRLGTSPVAQRRPTGMQTRLEVVGLPQIWGAQVCPFSAWGGVGAQRVTAAGRKQDMCRRDGFQLWDVPAVLKITSWAAGPWCSVTSAGGRDPHGPPALQGRQEEALLPHHLAQCKPFLLPLWALPAACDAARQQQTPKFWAHQQPGAVPGFLPLSCGFSHPQVLLQVSWERCAL